VASPIAVIADVFEIAMFSEAAITQISIEETRVSYPATAMPANPLPTVPAWNSLDVPWFAKDCGSKRGEAASIAIIVPSAKIAMLPKAAITKATIDEVLPISGLMPAHPVPTIPLPVMRQPGLQGEVT
jgi:hypothetical protein